MGRKFERIHEVVEEVEDYRPGGFHPVHIGDVFDFKYKVIRKLSYGSSSTIWLVEVEDTSAFFALKILKAAQSDLRPFPEDAVFRDCDPIALYPVVEHVMITSASFYHRGPNGTHLCIVMPVASADVGAHAQELYDFRLPFEACRSIVKQVAEGLSFIHSWGIVHGDLHPGNVVFSISTSDIEKALKDQRNECCPVKWLEGVESDDSAPDYLVVPEPIFKRSALHGDSELDCSVQIIDFGSASREGQDTMPVTPRSFRSPELVGSGPFTSSAKSDIWSLGCLVFEILIGQPLFCVATFMMEEKDIENEHRELMETLVGPELSPEAGAELLVKQAEELVNEKLTADEAALLTLIRKDMLLMDPMSRKSAKELLEEKLFA